MTRAVRAQQEGKSIFTLMCSFAKPEHQVRGGLGHQPSMPTDIKPPEDCAPTESRYENALGDESLSETARIYFAEMLADRKRSATEVGLHGRKLGRIMTTARRQILLARPSNHGRKEEKALWMRTKSAGKHKDPRFARCILSYSA